MNQQEMSVWVESQLVAPRREIQAKEVLLVLFLVDDSGSIEGGGNTQAVIDGYNGFMEALRNAPGEVRVKTMFLNNLIDLPFQNPKDVGLLSERTYGPTAGTPLFLRSVQALNSVLNEAKSLVAQGFTVRTMSFIFTDGGDNQSGLITASNAKVVVDVMLTTGMNIVGGCAVNDGRTNFWQVFISMGIPEHWIKVLKNDRTEVREHMTEMGTMASGASTGHESYTQTSQTGFWPRK